MDVGDLSVQMSLLKVANNDGLRGSRLEHHSRDVINHMCMFIKCQSTVVFRQGYGYVYCNLDQYHSSPPRRMHYRRHFNSMRYSSRSKYVRRSQPDPETREPVNITNVATLVLTVSETSPPFEKRCR